jgi:hypothetical protein
MADKTYGFEEIKRGLNPLFSYILVEKTDDKDGEAEFQRLLESLSLYRECVLEHDIFREPSSEKLYLVVKLDRFVADDILMKVFSGMSDHSSVYLYNGTENKA